MRVANVLRIKCLIISQIGNIEIDKIYFKREKLKIFV